MVATATETVATTTTATLRTLEAGGADESAPGLGSRLRRSMSRLLDLLPTARHEHPHPPSDSAGHEHLSGSGRRRSSAPPAASRRPMPLSVQRRLDMPLLCIPAHLHRDSLLYKRAARDRRKSSSGKSARLEFVLDTAFLEQVLHNNDGDNAVNGTNNNTDNTGNGGNNIAKPVNARIQVGLQSASETEIATLVDPVDLNRLKQHCTLVLPADGEENLLGQPLDLVVALIVPSSSSVNATRTLFEEHTRFVLQQSINGFLDARVHSQQAQSHGAGPIAFNYYLQDIYGQPFSLPRDHKDAETDGDSEEDRERQHNRECIICLSDDRTTVVLPCRHLCLCGECAEALRLRADRCPMCRESCQALMQIGPLPPNLNSIPRSSQ